MTGRPESERVTLSTAVHGAVPFVDLAPVTEAVREALLADIEGLLDTNAFVNGPPVEEFERAFADWCGTDQCVGVASGLDAIRLGLLAAGVGGGDEVVVPALTFVATFEAVSQAGATPVVVDVRESDYALDPKAAAAATGTRTRCLLPVHLYGQMADMRALLEVAGRHGLAVLEDACQAHGAERDGLRAGAAGDLGAFSFYPSKNLGAMGDAGALVTRDADLASRVRALREHGETSKYRSEWPGYTARLDTIQALVLLRKLLRMEEWKEQRAQAAAVYTRELEGVGDLRLPPVASGSAPAWHLYVVRTGEPERLATYLREHGIGTGRHYPEPPHLSRAYSGLGLAPGAFPVAEAIARECLSLPLFVGISESQLARVCDAVAGYFAAGG